MNRSIRRIPLRRMRRMCTDINFILNAVKDSALMEVKRHMIRRRCTTC
ncbi:hypothetical protein Patl1_08043 [Pistacia atlantica]|uniref:Uncharacterized protein n=1 Tax=Pistacia atlantica TaxID=434234 RepID=A0ACC1AKG2_9ROSI|nr:hypothetical protein Patl1_08043 [Pistacia atlantica]